MDLFDLGARKLLQLYRAVYEPNYTQEYGHFEEIVDLYAEEKIVPEEQKIFKKFYSEKHLHAVLEDKDAREQVTILLHKRMPDKERVLRLHHLVPFRLGQRDYVISCVQTINENIIGAAIAALAGEDDE